VLAPRRQTLLPSHLLFPGVAIYQEQGVHADHHLNGRAIVWIDLNGVNEFTPGVRPAAYMH
jgi:hypothetical protein